MDLIIDASSVINLDNAGALELVAGLKGRTLWLSPLVIGECKPTCAAEILRLEKEGKLKLIDPDNVSAEQFLGLLELHELGEGETECLALCHEHDYVLCCDDQKARNVAADLIGNERVVGSLRLLKWCVADGIISAEAAFAVYESMKQAGGFLPLIELDWFSNNAE